MITYIKKDGKLVEVDNTPRESEGIPYQNLLNEKTRLESELAIVNKRITEADKLGVKAEVAVVSDVTPN